MNAPITVEPDEHDEVEPAAVPSEPEPRRRRNPLALILDLEDTEF